jgi:hypothetical protein
LFTRIAGRRDSFSVRARLVRTCASVCVHSEIELGFRVGFAEGGKPENSVIKHRTRERTYKLDLRTSTEVRVERSRRYATHASPVCVSSRSKQHVDMIITRSSHVAETNSVLIIKEFFISCCFYAFITMNE